MKSKIFTWFVILSLILCFASILFLANSQILSVSEINSNKVAVSNSVPTITVTLAPTTVTPAVLVNNILINVPLYKQKYALSCEAAATSTVLRALGLAVTEDQFLANLEYDKTPRTTDSSGKITWGNPYNAFVGDYNGIFHKTGYGVYAPAISVNAKKYGAKSESYLNMDFENLLTQLTLGKLAIVWVPTRFEIQETKYWYTPDGVKIPWIDHEHAMVIYGFDRQRDQILLMDVATGTYMQKSFAEFQRGWSYLGNQAVTVYNSVKN